MLLSLLALLLAGLPARAKDAGPRRFDIPAGDARVTLKRAALQAGLEIVYSATVVRGVRTHSVAGEFTPRRALELMVANTPLKILEDSQTGVLSVLRPPDSDPPSQAPPAPPKHPPKTAMHRKTPLGFLAGLIAAATAPLPAAENPAPAAGGSTVEMSEIAVVAFRERGYGAKLASSATRFAIPISDVPVNVNVMSREFLTDINESDARNSLAWNASFSGPVNRTIRGFSGISEFIDGHRYSLLLYPVGMFERVEIVKGPSSLMFGRTNPGGSVNYVRAKPNPFDSFARLKLGVGAVNGNIREHYSGDLNHNFGKLSVRLIGGYAQFEDTGQPNFFHTGLKHGGSRYGFITPIVSAQLTRDTKVAVGFSNNRGHIRSQDSRHSARSILESGIPISVRYNLDPFLDFGWGRRFTYRMNDTFLNVDHVVNDNLSVHLDFNYHLGNWFQPNNPVSNGIVVDGRAVARQVFLRDQRTERIPDGILHARYQHFGRNSQHNFILSLAESSHRITTAGWQARNPDGTPFIRDVYYLEQPIPRSIPDSLTYVSNGTSFRETRMQTLTASWLGMFAENRFNVLAAVANNRVKDEQGNGLVIENDTFDPLVGVTYRLSSEYALFAMGSSSLDVTNQLDGFNRPFKPVRARGFEGGLKVSLAQDKVFGSITGFNIVNDDTVVFDPTASNITYEASGPPGMRNEGLRGAQAQIGQVESFGFETDLQFNLTRSWLANISYCYVTSEIKKDPNPANLGKEPLGHIPHKVTFYNKYKFLKGPLQGFDIGGGIIWRDGELDAQGANRFVKEQFTQVDLLVGYTTTLWQDVKTHIRATGRNLTEGKNANYGYNPATNNRYAFKNPRTLWLDVTFEF